MENINVHEVGMRDGLQMEKSPVPTESKILWIDKLIESGLDIIQLGSFVNPAKVPQMSDTDELFRYYSNHQDKKRNTVLSGLVLNEKGLERATECGVDLICMGVSASETHSTKNTGMSVSDAVSRIVSMAQETMSAGKKTQVSVQSAFGCGFEGAVDEKRVYSIIEKYIEAGIKNISLADTAGHAYPEKVKRMFGKIFELSSELELTCHFHNTYGLGMANCITAINSGVRSIETAFGGLGGCPFTKIAAGNVCTDDFVHYLHRTSTRKDIQLAPIIDVSRLASEFFEKELPGFVYKTGGLKY